MENGSIQNEYKMKLDECAGLLRREESLRERPFFEIQDLIRLGGKPTGMGRRQKAARIVWQKCQTREEQGRKASKYQL